MAAYDYDNPFARILGETPPRTTPLVHESEHAVAFPPLRNNAPVHLLIIPRGAFIDEVEFHMRGTAAEITGFWRTVAELAASHAPDGHRLVSCNGLVGGQDVFHFHVHLLGGRRFGALVDEPTVV